MKIGRTDIAIIVTLLVFLIGTSVTIYTAFRWVAQDLAAIPSLFFLIATVIIGFMLVGKLKIKRPQGVNWFKLHRKIGVYFAVLMVITIAHGLYDRFAHGESFFWQHPELSVTVVHGYLGLVVVILALVQVIPSLAIKDRRKLRELHLVLAYTLLVLVIVEVILGIGTALAEIAGD